MKKFFVSLFFIIILAALGLFFGWAQLGVPPDAYGVMRSKTHGTDTHLIVPGEFRWVWYKLIPTNVTTSVFRLNPVQYDFSAHDSLPAGNVYAAFAGIEDNFSWDMRASFSFCLKPDAIISLVANNTVSSQADLLDYENALAGNIETFIRRRLNTDDDFSREIESLLSDGDCPELVRLIEAQFPQIYNVSFTVKSTRFPDYALYKMIKGLYGDYIALQKEYMTGELREKAQNRTELIRRFDELEQYGALLSKYPILLDFLTLENSVVK